MIPQDTLSRNVQPFDPAEFESAYVKSFSKTVKFIRSLGASYETAEEIAQAAWARGWQCRHQLIQRQFLVTWVNAIARNYYREFIGKANLLSELSDYGKASDIPKVLEVDSIVNRCSPLERNLLEKHYLEGYSSKEIAKQSNTNAITVRIRLMRLRRSLRERLSKDTMELQFVEA